MSFTVLRARGSWGRKGEVLSPSKNFFSHNPILLPKTHGQKKLGRRLHIVDTHAHSTTCRGSNVRKWVGGSRIDATGWKGIRGDGASDCTVQDVPEAKKK